MHSLLPKEKFSDFLKELCYGRDVFTIEDRGGKLHLVSADTWKNGQHILGAYRTVEPLKSLVFPVREFTGSLFNDTPVPEKKERIVIGVKNCDLSALRIHDHVFLSDPVDPYYKELRDKTLIVSCDCTDAMDVCFCPVVGEQPYAKTGFDINISPVSQGYIIESGSGRGEQALSIVSQHLQPADKTLSAERDSNRAAIKKKVANQALALGLPEGQNLKGAIVKSAGSKLWDDFAKDCVECGACNFVCCTCHCFLLADGTINKEPNRVKQWDSCLLPNFARVAGGHNPRKHRAERLHNRFDKKFNYFPTVLKTIACDGCGRCVEACTGKIDIREVLKRALDEAKSV